MTRLEKPASTTTIERPEVLNVRTRIDDLEFAYDAVLRQLRRASLPALRITLGVIYLWYGVLKIANVSPATDLVRNMLTIIGSPAWSVPALGFLEAFIGLWWIIGYRVRYLLPLFVAHMLGTMAVLVALPATSYQHHNPLELTFTGEFVTKNFVLLAAGIAVVALMHRDRREHRED